MPSARTIEPMHVLHRFDHTIVSLSELPRLLLCYTEKAPNVWHRRGTQNAGNTYGFCCPGLDAAHGRNPVLHMISQCLSSHSDLECPRLCEPASHRLHQRVGEPSLAAPSSELMASLDAVRLFSCHSAIAYWLFLHMLFACLPM